MLIHKLIVGSALAGAIAVTALFTSFAASSALAASGGGAATVFEPIPYYVLRWENPLLPATSPAPFFGQ